MGRKLAVLFGLLSVVAVGAANAQNHGQAPIQVGDVWARASAGMSKTSAAYAMLANRGQAEDKLVSASAPAIAGTVELHTMTMDGDVMRMRQIPAIELKPGSEVELKPGGLHIMLMDLKAPLKEGQKFPLTLNFEKAGASTVEVTVRSVAAIGAAPMQHMHK